MEQPAKLSDLFKIGSSKRILKSQWQKKGIPFYRGREITKLSKEGFVDNELFISEKLYSDFLGKHGVPTTGDIMITAIGTIGNSYIVREGDRFYFKDASVLWLKKKAEVSTEFINLWLKSSLMKEQLDEGNGATVDTLTIKKLQSLVVGLPPIKEQEHIVAILDQAFAEIEKARANAEQNLKNARELFESCLNSRLLYVCSTKPEQTLSCVTEIIVDCEHKTAPTQEEGFPSIRTPNIGKGKLLLEGVRRVSEETYNLWTKRAVPQYGDLILAREAPAGNVGVIPKGETVCLGQRTVLIRPKAETVNPKFLAFLLVHPIMQERLLAHSTGATVQHVNMKDIRKLSISKLPFLDEQINDVNILENIQSKVVHLESIYSKKIEALDELKKSILQKAFTGKLSKEITI